VEHTALVNVFRFRISVVIIVYCLRIVYFSVIILVIVNGNYIGCV